MADQVEMTHAHDDGPRPMQHVDDEHIDGLRLQQYTCACGFSAAVLTRLMDELPGGSWPFRFETRRPVS